MKKQAICFMLIFFVIFSFGIEGQKKKASKPEQKKSMKKEEKKDFPPIDKFIKGFKEIKGFYTLYKKKEKLYALIKNSQLNKPFLMALSISGGPLFTGYQWDHMVVQWEEMNKKLALVKPNLKHRTSKNSTLKFPVSSTYTDSVIHSVQILSKGKGGVLIDLSRVLKSDVGQISWIIRYILGGAGLRSDLSSWDKIKAFPENLEIAVNTVFMGGGGFFGYFAEHYGYVADARGIKMKIHYSFSNLPKGKYKPRKADDRVGYFLTVFKDYDVPYNSRSRFVRYINRWHLEKADASLKLSPPKKPIVFYIEKTVPVRFRLAVKAGILEWNKAFEKLGIKDAIEVRQQTETEFVDLDPEDVRYNFFRWTTLGSGYAMGPSRANPLTGEILDADIIFNDKFVRYVVDDFDTWGPKNFAQMIDSKTLNRLSKNPVWKKFGKKVQEVSPDAKDFFKKVFTHSKWTKRWGKPTERECCYAAGKMHQLAFLMLLHKAKTVKELPEEFMEHHIKDIVTHEVGHTLGLRHNFKASSWLSLDKINSKDKPEVLSASVMDYNAINYPLKDCKTKGNYTNLTIGPYDYWAIKYGYGFPGKGENEEKFLKNVLKETAKKEYNYATDEDVSFIFNPDPLTARWDLGDDPVKFAKHHFALYEELKAKILTDLVKPGESYYYARRAFNIMLFDRLYASLVAYKNIGGEYFHRDHKGDSKERAPYVLVDVKKQRETLKFFAEKVFSEDAYKFSPKLLNHLPPSRWRHWGSNSGVILQFLHFEIIYNQIMPLLFLHDRFFLERIYDAELKVEAGKDKITMVEIVTTIANAIWSELDKKIEKDKKLSIFSTRRNLQYSHLMLLKMLYKTWYFGAFFPSDIKSVIAYTLENINEKIEKKLKDKDKLDLYTTIHLKDCHRFIKKTLDDKDKDGCGCK